ncbi:MAG: CHAT domain-containing protein [Terracoccus sp.]
MTREYLDFDVAIIPAQQGYTAQVLRAPAGPASAPFSLPFAAADLAQFMVAVGPPRVTSRRLVPAVARVADVKEYGRRLGDALFSGDVGTSLRDSLAAANSQGNALRVRLRLEAVPELDSVPWEYLYDTPLDRFLTLSRETPVVRVLDSLEPLSELAVQLPLKVLVLISSPSDLPSLAVERERQLLVATTGDLAKAGLLDLVVMEGPATLGALQKALIDEYNVFHFIGHGGFDETAQEGVLALETAEGTVDRVSGARLGTLLHDAQGMQLAVLNACEGARTSSNNAFSGVGQTLVRQGLPAVVAMQTEISDRAALVFSHEFYWYLTRGLGIDAAICEVRKAMALSDGASEWGTAVLLRSGSDQPFTFPTAGEVAEPARETRWESLYDAAQGALSAHAPETALPMLEQLAAERPDYQDVTALIERVRPGPVSEPATATPAPAPAPATPDAAPEPSPASTPPPPVRATRGRRSWARPLGLLLVLALIWAGGSWWWANGLGVMVGCGLAERPASNTQASYTFGCATTEPTIDGHFDDWAGVGAGISIEKVVSGARPAQPFRATWQGQWSSDALFVHVRVTDASLRSVDAGRPDQWWSGDGVSFEFGPDNRGLSSTARPRTGQDVHLMVGLTASGAEAAANPAAGKTFPSGGRRTDVTAARAVTPTGYELEARIPWSAIGLTEAPERGTVVATNLNVSDASPTGGGGLRTMISSNPKRTGPNQLLPATWQRLVLGDTSS